MTTSEQRKAYNKAYYEKNKDRHRESRARRRDVYRKIAQDYVNRSKIDKPCTDCGKVYLPVVMDYDHLPGFEKSANVSSLVQKGMAISKIQEEIAKCELVCANCHRIRTWVRKGSKPYDFDTFVIY